MEYYKNFIIENKVKLPGQLETPNRSLHTQDITWPWLTWLNVKGNSFYGDRQYKLSNYLLYIV